MVRYLVTFHSLSAWNIRVFVVSRLRYRALPSDGGVTPMTRQPRNVTRDRDIPGMACVTCQKSSPASDPTCTGPLPNPSVFSLPIVRVCPGMALTICTGTLSMAAISWSVLPMLRSPVT